MDKFTWGGKYNRSSEGLGRAHARFFLSGKIIPDISRYTEKLPGGAMLGTKSTEKDVSYGSRS